MKNTYIPSHLWTMITFFVHNLQENMKAGQEPDFVQARILGMNTAYTPQSKLPIYESGRRYHSLEEVREAVKGYCKSVRYEDGETRLCMDFPHTSFESFIKDKTVFTKCNSMSFGRFGTKFSREELLEYILDFDASVGEFDECIRNTETDIRRIYKAFIIRRATELSKNDASDKKLGGVFGLQFSAEITAVMMADVLKKHLEGIVPKWKLTADDISIRLTVNYPDGREEISNVQVRDLEEIVTKLCDEAA